MKKLISFVLLLVMMVTMVACDTTKTEAEGPAEGGTETKQTFMEYGKKYFSPEVVGKWEYVFEEDQTGYCVVHYTFESELSDEYNFTRSGRADFIWREASDGAVYLFKTKITYNDDHTEGYGFDVISGPIYFGEDFFVHSGRHYIIEGSALAESLKK